MSRTSDQAIWLAPLDHRHPLPHNIHTMTHDNLPASIENLSARIIAIRDSL